MPAGVFAVSAVARSRFALLESISLVALVILIVAASANIARWVATQPVSFDGAMNLEVARSLAEGTGYRRMYADHLGFSHAIQTRAPYILPAAAVFAAFGVGIWQAQIVNALYLVAFAALVFVLVRRFTSWRWALAAVAACLCTPGIEDNALNGFGEVPALTWWLAALAVLYGARDDALPDARRCFVAGLLLGTAIVTKTVLLIGVFAAAAVLVAEVAARERRVRPLVALALAAGAGLALPLLLHEVCRVFALGGFTPWRAWLGDEWRMIAMQAGTRAGFPDNDNVATKVHNHFGVLVAGLGMRHGIVAAWLLLPVLLLAGSWRAWMTSRARPLIATLAVFAIVYLVWWLAVTPTEKAWYRRIFNGAIAWDLLTVLLIAVLWRHRARFSGVSRVLFGAAAALALAIGIALAQSSLAGVQGGEDAPLRLARELEAVRRLPSDAPLYGVGWYSMPGIALYAGRRLGDLNDRPTSALETTSPVYLLIDETTRRAGIEAYWLDRYDHSEVAAVDDFAIIELKTDRRRDPFSGVAVDAARLRDYVDFHGAEYPYVFGFYQREADGWRWARTDVEALLKYGGEPTLQIDIYLPRAAYYHRRKSPSITAWIGGCKVGVVSPAPLTRSALRLPLASCAPPVGSVVRVRLLADDVGDSTDDRQLAFVTHGFGFVATAP